MTTPLFAEVAPVVPEPKIALPGRFVPAGPMLLYEMVLLSLPVVTPAPMMIVPALPPTFEPKIVQLVIVLLVASLTNRMVLVVSPFDTVVLVMVNEFPPVFNPSMVTRSAPFRSTNGNVGNADPEMVRGTPPKGTIRI